MPAPRVYRDPFNNNQENRGMSERPRPGRRSVGAGAPQPGALPQGGGAFNRSVPPSSPLVPSLKPPMVPGPLDQYNTPNFNAYSTMDGRTENGIDPNGVLGGLMQDSVAATRLQNARNMYSPFEIKQMQLGTGSVPPATVAPPPQLDSSSRYYAPNGEPKRINGTGTVAIDNGNGGSVMIGAGGQQALKDVGLTPRALTYGSPQSKAAAQRELKNFADRKGWEQANNDTYIAANERNKKRQEQNRNDRILSNAIQMGLNPNLPAVKRAQEFHQNQLDEIAKNGGKAPSDYEQLLHDRDTFSATKHGQILESMTGDPARLASHLESVAPGMTPQQRRVLRAWVDTHPKLSKPTWRQNQEDFDRIHGAVGAPGTKKRPPAKGSSLPPIVPQYGLGL